MRRPHRSTVRRDVSGSTVTSAPVPPRDVARATTRLTTSTPRGPSSTNVSPSSAFLSRPISAISSSASSRRARSSAARSVPPTTLAVLPRPARRRCARAAGRARRRTPARSPTASPWVSVVAGGDLEGVGQRVPVVEQRPPAALALVGGDDVGLDLHAAGDPVGEVHRLEVVAGEEVVLRHLAVAASAARAPAASPSASRSQTTPDGCQNAPTRFLPSGRLTPVLPPIAASTMPSSVVATWTTGTPRCHVAAANPATSVTMPPPTADRRRRGGSGRCGRTPRHSGSIVASDLCASPSPISIALGGQPAGRLEHGMPAWVTTAARRAVGGSRPASSATAPWPTTTSYVRSPSGTVTRCSDHDRSASSTTASTSATTSSAEAASVSTTASATSRYSGSRSGSHAAQRGLGIVVEQRPVLHAWSPARRGRRGRRAATRRGASASRRARRGSPAAAPRRRRRR